MRNVISLSDVPPDLHEWLKDEAKRRSTEMRTKVKLYQVVVEALQRYRHDVEESRRAPTPAEVKKPVAPGKPSNGGFEYFLRDGRGPYPDVRSALQDLDIPESEKPKHNRYDRLALSLKIKIIRRPKNAPESQAVTNA